MLRLLALLLTISAVVSFRVPALSSRQSHVARDTALNSRRRERRKNEAEVALPTGTVDYVVGEDIPEELQNLLPIYDMVLVERFAAPLQTASGLLLPEVTGKDQMHVGKVLAVPTSYGLESEQGRLAPVEEIIPYKVGDSVYIRDPWGIGPLNFEYGDRCFSFHKAIQITGKIASSA
mmetsp:Transcript_14716/g.24390  ORF Transcript_14716/g.24390 Transcript_14716/m.24390 type:complete len:177 (-) Transcript_14716:584-1114(-)